MNKEIFDQLKQLQETITASIHKMNDILMVSITDKRNEMTAAVSNYIAAMEEAKDFTYRITEVGDKISSLGDIYGAAYADQNEIVYIGEDLLGSVDDYENPEDEEEVEDSNGDDEEDE